MTNLFSKSINYIKSVRKYFIKFAIVGISGIIVNQGFLTLFVEMGMRLSIAGILAIELSILSNFFLNNYWTWKKKNAPGILARLIKYHLVTAVSGIINYLILLLLTHYGLHYFISNLIGIGIGMIINFILNHFWTFGPDKEKKH